MIFGFAGGDLPDIREVERSAKCKCKGGDVEMPKRREFIAGVMGGSVGLFASASTDASVKGGMANMAQEVDACVKPAAGPLIPKTAGETQPAKEVAPMVPLARVGKEAPDFEATAYIPGEGFKLVKLSDYRGKWVVLCFYPGDFTFV